VSGERSTRERAPETEACAALRRAPHAPPDAARCCSRAWPLQSGWPSAPSPQQPPCSCSAKRRLSGRGCAPRSVGAARRMGRACAPPRCEHPAPPTWPSARLWARLRPAHPQSRVALPRFSAASRLFCTPRRGAAPAHGKHTPQLSSPRRGAAAAVAREAPAVEPRLRATHVLLFLTPSSARCRRSC
jgi:hypothetical protein